MNTLSKSFGIAPIMLALSGCGGSEVGFHWEHTILNNTQCVGNKMADLIPCQQSLLDFYLDGAHALDDEPPLIDRDCDIPYTTDVRISNDFVNDPDIFSYLHNEEMLNLKYEVYYWPQYNLVDGCADPLWTDKPTLIPQGLSVSESWAQTRTCNEGKGYELQFEDADPIQERIFTCVKVE